MRKKIILMSLVLFFATFLVGGQSSAKVYANNGGSSCEVSNFFGFPPWYKYLQPLEEDSSGGCNVKPIEYPGDNSINAGATIGAVLLANVENLLMIAGIVAVGYVIYGGVSYTISQGTPEKTVAARTIILNGLIGLVIAALAVVIVNLVGNIVT